MARRSDEYAGRLAVGNHQTGSRERAHLAASVEEVQSQLVVVVEDLKHGMVGDGIGRPHVQRPECSGRAAVLAGRGVAAAVVGLFLRLARPRDVLSAEILHESAVDLAVVAVDDEADVAVLRVGDVEL